MPGGKAITVGKVISILGFLVLLCTTYYLRAEVLALNRIRYSADNVKADEDLKEMKESHPERVARHELELTHHEIEMQHYRDMMELFRTDYDEYTRRMKQREAYGPPSLPRAPGKPRSPEVSDKLTRINAEFRARKYHYFAATSSLTWAACAAALLLVGGLLFLLMFDVAGQRLFYVVVLVLSFVFLIGPAFHTILSAIVGYLRPPGVY